MIKWIARLVFVVVVLVILALVGAYFYGDALARTGIEKAGAYATGQTTTLDSVSLGIFSGNLSLEKLAIDNPKGFTADHFLTLGEGQVAVSLSSLMGDTVHVPELHLSDIGINLEQAGGKRNYQVILDHLQQLSSSQPTQDAKKWIIDDLQIKNIHVNAQAALAGVKVKPISITIPRIVLKDVRSDSTAKLQGEVLRQILNAVIQQAGGQLPKQLMTDLGGQLQSLGDLGKATQKQVEEAGKQLHETADQMLKGVGGIFNDKKKDK